MSRRTESRIVRVVPPDPTMKAPDNGEVARSKRLPLISNVPPDDPKMPPIIPPVTSVMLESTMSTWAALSKTIPPAPISMPNEVICNEMAMLGVEVAQAEDG